MKTPLLFILDGALVAVFATALLVWSQAETTQTTVENRRVEWIDPGKNFSITQGKRRIYIGLRSDGVVVWKDNGKAP